METPYPIIAVTSRGSQDKPEPFPELICVRESYLQALIKAGAAPMILPRTDDPKVIGPLLDIAHGLLLPGGSDLDPMYYSEVRHPKCEESELLRDRSEMLVLKEAFTRKLPILGICRGAQLLNVFFGGSLIQDIKDQCPHILDGHPSGAFDQIMHDVLLQEASKLAGIFNARKLKVNSIHHQAVARLGANLRASAISPDGVVEGIEHSTADFIMGVQWHPELLCQSICPEGCKLFEALVRHATTRI